MILKTCLHCNREFQARNTRQKYCSRKCLEQYRTKNLPPASYYTKYIAYETAIELVMAKRITITMAAECLKVAGLSPAEIQDWRNEYNERVL